MNKKVSVIFPYAESYDSYYGGAIARWVYEVSKRVSDKFDITIYAASDNNDYGKVINSNYGKYCDFIKHIERQYAKNRLLDKLIYQIKRLTCRDVIWINSLFSKLKGSEVIIIHNRPKVPDQLRSLGFRGEIVLHMHNSHLFSSTTKVVNKLYKSVDTILFCSEFLKAESLERYPFLRHKSKVLYNGVIDICFPKVKKEKVILFAGRIIDSKGVLELILAFDKIKKRHPDYKLHIVGGVSSGTSYQKTTYLLKVENEINNSNYKEDISFIGYLSHGDLLAKMNKSEILAVPSKWKEPFGMVALEGVVNHCKVVATANGGMPEILGDSGFYCECSPGSISEALDEAARTINYESVNRYDKFLWDEIASEFNVVID